VFISSATHDGNFNPWQNADALCQQLATTAGLSGTFKAWLSPSALNQVASRFSRSTKPYRLVTGDVVANDWDDLIDGRIAHAIDRDEYGSLTSATSVWTGTHQSGLWGPDHCTAWKSADPGGTGVRGAVYNLTAWSLNVPSLSCDQQLPVYCFQQ